MIIKHLFISTISVFLITYSSTAQDSMDMETPYSPEIGIEAGFSFEDDTMAIVDAYVHNIMYQINNNFYYAAHKNIQVLHKMGLEHNIPFVAGYADMLAGYYEQKVERYDRAIELYGKANGHFYHPDSLFSYALFDSYYNIAHAYMKMGKFNDALNKYTEIEYYCDKEGDLLCSYKANVYITEELFCNKKIDAGLAELEYLEGKLHKLRETHIDTQAVDEVLTLIYARRAIAQAGRHHTKSSEKYFELTFRMTEKYNWSLLETEVRNHRKNINDHFNSNTSKLISIVFPLTFPYPPKYHEYPVRSIDFYLEMASNYEDSDDLVRAIDITILAKSIAEKYKLTDRKLICERRLVYYYQLQGNYHLALGHLNNESKLINKLFGSELGAVFKEYARDTAEQKRNLALMEEGKELKEKLANNLTIILIIVVLALAISSVLAFKLRQSNNKLRDANEANKRLKKAVVHADTNNYETLKEMIDNTKDNLTDYHYDSQRGYKNHLKACFEVLQRSIKSLQNLNQILHVNISETDTKSLKEFCLSIASYQCKVSGYDSDIIVNKKFIYSPVINNKVAEYLGMVIQELIANSLKHGYPYKRRPVLTLSAIQKGKNIKIKYEDDGVGYSKSKKLKEKPTGGQGDKMIKRNIEENLEGSLDTQNDGRLKIITIPLKNILATSPQVIHAALNNFAK